MLYFSSLQINSPTFKENERAQFSRKLGIWLYVDTRPFVSFKKLKVRAFIRFGALLREDHRQLRPNF